MLFRSVLADRLVASDGTHEERHVAGAKDGLQARYGGRPAADWARDLVAIARDGLLEIGEDAGLLDPLAGRVASGRSPALDIIDAWERDPSPANILPVIRY